MKTKLWVGGILALFVLYLALSFNQAVRFIGTDDWIAKGIGIATLVIPALGVWILIREVLFGLRTQKMAAQMEAAGQLPEDTLPRTPAGRIVRAAADEDFKIHKADVEENPESWQSWYRLALAYDASGDRKRARESMRTSIGFWLGRANS